MQRNHPVAVGNRTEAKVLAALIELFGTVCIPFGDGCRYDMIVDTPTDLYRIQCKTGRYRKGVIEFKTCSYKNGNSRSYYQDADWFGVYCREFKSVYLVPVKVCGASAANLRVDPPKNNQDQRVRYAKDFLIWSQEKGVADPNGFNPWQT